MQIPDGVTAVGAKILREEPSGLEGLENLEVYKGVSYCEAASRAKKAPLLVREGSIETCKWAPAILALKDVEDAFDKKQRPRLQGPVKAMLLAPLASFPGGYEPDSVILQGPAETLRKLMWDLGKDEWALNCAGEMETSALRMELDGLPPWKVTLVAWTNRLLARITPSKAWQRFIKLAAASRLAGPVERALKPFIASMSVCRNSTAIPILEEKANLSFFCAGGILWGGNPSTHMTCGVPYSFMSEGNVRG